MNNIEIKAKYDDFKKAKRILCDIGAQFSWSGDQIDTYYIVKNGKLKIRETSSGECQLIPYFRDGTKDIKYSDYLLLPIEDIPSAKRLFSTILETETIVEKHRDVYLLNNTRIHLDDVNGLGKFIEFEDVQISDSKINHAFNKGYLKGLMDKFDIDDSRLIANSYRKLMLTNSIINDSSCKVVVLTGPPSCGKSEILKSILPKENELITIKELASILIAGGFPIPNDKFDLDQQLIFQRNMLECQKNLEDLYQLQNPNVKAMVLDRARLDCAGYWPDTVDNFIRTFGLSIEKEYNRYHSIIYLEAPDEEFYGGQNEIRYHSYSEALEIGRKQKEIYQKHPHFFYVPKFTNFSEKIALTREIVDLILNNASVIDIKSHIKATYNM